ncbi:divergent polysaccharide deacetylase family protein [Brevirhabdus sp.]|uniref:divergent polysaccharide deacetylase family protein n=1 Tax=Brevirhabdus sp. TaxID=2004514 RepID=UPI0040599E46
MGKGLLSGAIWGGAVSTLALSIVSISNPVTGPSAQDRTLPQAAMQTAGQAGGAGAAVDDTSRRGATAGERAADAGTRSPAGTAAKPAESPGVSATASADIRVQTESPTGPLAASRTQAGTDVPVSAARDGAATDSLPKGATRAAPSIAQGAMPETAEPVKSAAARPQSQPTLDGAGSLAVPKPRAFAGSMVIVRNSKDQGVDQVFVGGKPVEGHADSAPALRDMPAAPPARMGSVQAIARAPDATGSGRSALRLADEARVARPEDAAAPRRLSAGTVAAASGSDALPTARPDGAQPPQIGDRIAAMADEQLTDLESPRPGRDSARGDVAPIKAPLSGLPQLSGQGAPSIDTASVAPPPVEPKLRDQEFALLETPANAPLSAGARPHRLRLGEDRLRVASASRVPTTDAPALPDSAPLPAARPIGVRLPQIVTPGQTEIARRTPADKDASVGSTGGGSTVAGQKGAGKTETPGTALATAGALKRYARPFDVTAGRPLMSIVLIDDGRTQPDAEALKSLSFPVTFAIDPSLPDATRRAEMYRAAGQEVLVLAQSLTRGTTPAKADAILKDYAARLPEAVGLMDRTGQGLRTDRKLLAEVIRSLADRGQGLLVQDRGLNTVAAAAERQGVETALVFRALDADKERWTVIKRYLDRAAFKAAKDGSVVMVGHTYPDTYRGILEWSLDGRAEAVALAPISAVMKTR